MYRVYCRINMSNVSIPTGCHPAEVCPYVKTHTAWYKDFPLKTKYHIKAEFTHFNYIVDVFESTIMLHWQWPVLSFTEIVLSNAQKSFNRTKTGPFPLSGATPLTLAD